MPREEATQEARRLRRLWARRGLRLTELLLEIGDAVLCLAQRHILDQRGLDQEIGRFWIAHNGLADELVRIRVLGLRWCLLEPSKEFSDQLLLLRCHCSSRLEVYWTAWNRRDAT